MRFTKTKPQTVKPDSTFPVLSAAITALMLSSLTGCNQPAAESSEVQAELPVANVEVLSISDDGAASTVRASGLIGYKREAALAFGAPGEIESIRVEIGDSVRSGQVLATLRRTTVGADAAESAIAEQTAQQNFERVERLHTGGAASDSDLDAARLALERSRTRVSLTASTAGVILRRDAERGQVVGAGVPVFWLGETRSGVVARASVTASEAVRLKVGDAAKIEVKSSGAFTGKVDRISPISVGAAGVFEVEVRFDAPAELRMGEVADVTIAAATNENAQRSFVVPSLAVIDARADQGVVFVVDENNVAERRAVQTAGVNDVGVIVIDGLSAGERVITRGASMLRDGETVHVVGE